jgi:hypothetical protein
MQAKAASVTDKDTTEDILLLAGGVALETIGQADILRRLHPNKATRLDPSNARVTAHLGRRLADQALKRGSEPDEARRARGEADFLTSRAQKLAPNNDEVKRSRDEVVRLLELKTN